MPKGKTKAAPRGKGKKKKDPNAPKKNLSAYMIFSNENRAKLKEESPNLKFGEIGKRLGAMWKELTEEEKKPFQKKAEEDKKRYLKEKEEYEKKQEDKEDDEEKEEGGDDDDDD